MTYTKHSALIWNRSSDSLSYVFERGVDMKERKIRLKSVEDAKNFVKVTTGCDFDVDLYDNSIVIDAKSILGVLSLDLRHVLVVSYNGENEELEAFLDDHMNGIEKIA